MEITTNVGLNIQVGCVLTASQINTGTFITSILSTYTYQLSQSYGNIGGAAITASTNNTTTLTLGSLSSSNLVGCYVFLYNSGTVLGTVLSQNGTSLTINQVIPTYPSQLFNFFFPYTFLNTPYTIPANTIITGGSGLNWTLNQSMAYPVVNSISYYNPNIYIQPSTSQIQNLTVQNGLTVSSGTVSLPSGSITNSMLATTYIDQSTTQTLTNKTLSSPTLSGTIVNNSTISTNGTTVSPTELGYLNGCSINIQTEFNALTSALATINSNASTFAGDKTFSGQIIAQNGLSITGGSLTIASGLSETDSGTLTVSGLLTANGGIQLPTSTYTTPSSNYLGYQPTITYTAMPCLIPTLTSTACASVVLSPGTWLLIGQVDFYSYSATSLAEIVSTVSISPTVGLNTAIESAFRYSNTLTVNSNFVQQVMGVVNITTGTPTYYLIGYSNYSAGLLMARTISSSTTAVTSGTTSAVTTVTISATNPAILVGMSVSGTGISGTCLVASISTITITLSSVQSIGNGVTLTFTFVSTSSFTATRIA